MLLRSARLGAVLALTAALSSPAAIASASDADEGGRWFYTAPGLPEVHQRTTGEGVTVAVLDGPVNTAAPDLVGADVQVHEPSYCSPTDQGEPYAGTSTGPEARHATSIATMIVGRDTGSGGQPGIPGVAPGVTLRSYSVYREDQPCETPAGQEYHDDDAMLDAVEDGAKIIVVPGTYDFSSDAVKQTLKAGAIIVAAGGNDGIMVTGSPAERNGVVVTGTVTSAVELDEGSCHGDKLGVVAPGAHIRAMNEDWQTYATTTGSSNSAAYTGGALALLWSLYPDATAGQILQALARTTDGEVKDTPVHDDWWGYGVVSARTLTSVDPTTYPDVNPFLREGALESPQAWEVTGKGSIPTEIAAGVAGQLVTPEATQAHEAEADAGAGVPARTFAVTGAGLLVMVVACAVVVRRRVRRHPRP